MPQLGQYFSSCMKQLDKNSWHFRSTCEGEKVDEQITDSEVTFQPIII